MGKRWWPLLLVAAGVLLVAVGVTYGRFQDKVANPGAVDMPSSLAGLPLTQSSFGTDAVKEVTRLHGQDFPLSAGGYGVYGRPEEMVILWAADAPLSIISRRMIAEMETAIDNETSPFTPTGTQEVNGRTVYELTGMGQKHFYFRAGSLVVWLAADPPLAESALTESLRFYP